MGTSPPVITALGFLSFWATAGAYGQPPERKEHQRPWLIDLTTDIGEETNIASENSILVDKIIHHAELFQRSITIEPSLLDRQFSAQKEN